ncbi:MAG: SusC/RagA family TonB-linked outer membrane protein [Niabella sp.]
MKKSIYLNFLTAVLLLFFNSVIAQNRITGTVTDESGTPIQGATVLVEGTETGTITNNLGIYGINVPGSKTSLIFSYVGKQTQTIAISNRTVINITLQSLTDDLDDVVVIGYGKVRKSDLTGSVSQIKTENTEQRYVTSTEELLQGAVPGVQINKTGGAPGTGMDVTIRGGNSLNGSNQPLYIIDGLEMNSSDAFFNNAEPSGATPPPSPLSMVNPNDIESIDILKDASATAIYGARGANGVVIITTKKGKVGKAVIQADFGTSTSKLVKKINVLNSKQWTQLFDEATVNKSLPPVYGDPNDLSTYDQYNKNVNWQDQMYRTAIGKDVSLAVRGGTNAFKYSISGNYNQTQGIIIKSDQERISTRANFEIKATKFLDIGMDNFFSRTNSDYVPYSNKGSNGFFSPIMMAVQFRAFSNAWDDDFDIKVDSLVDDPDAPYNPVAQLKNTTDEQRLSNAQSNLYANLKITPWLSFKSNFGFNYMDALRNSFWGTGTQQGDMQNNIVSRVQRNNFDYINENVFTIDKTFNRQHKINVVLGSSTHKWVNKLFAAKASGLDVTALGYESFDGAAVVETPVTVHTEWGLASFYGRANYTFDNRYLFTFTGRYDGSSRFAPGNKWAFFPSGAFAWKVDQEKFMQNIDAISNLKLRVSYGASGSQAIGVLSTIATLIKGYRYPISNTFLPGVSSSSYLFNKDLKWETTYQGNIGIDIGLLKNRINITADYYQKNTKDLLLDKDFPITGGFTSTTVNGGEIQNRGWELGINSDVIRKADLSWNLGISASKNRSKVIDLDGKPYVYGSSISGLDGGYPNISYLNRTVGLFYGFQTKGIYQTAAEAAAGPTKSGNAPEAGTVVYVDQLINGTADGVINDDDKVVIGNPQPDLIYGFTSNLTYKNFNLNFVINGTIGNDVLNLNNLVWEGMNIWDGRYSQTQRAFDGRWVSEAQAAITPATYPKASLNRINPDFTDRYIEDGSFLRMQSVTLSYNWRPKNIKMIQAIRPFISASNLFLISNYSGYDPEIRGLNTALSPGIDLGAYPLPRTFKFGLSVTLN